MKRILLAIGIAAALVVLPAGGQQLIDRNQRAGGSYDFFSDGSLALSPNANGRTRLNGFLDLASISTPALGPTGASRIFYNGVNLQVSIEGGAYSPLTPGSSSSILLGGGTVAVNADGSISLTPAAGKNTSISPGNLTVAGTVTAGSGPTTLTDATGKILSASMNTVQPGQGGTGSTSAPNSGQLLIGNNTNTYTVAAPTSADDISVTAGNGSLSIGRATSASGAYFIFPVIGTGSAVSQNTSVPNANNTRVWKIYIPARITVTNVVFSIKTSSAATHVGVGVFSLDGNTKLVDTGAVSSAATGVQNISVSATLSPGFYWLAFTSDSTIPVLDGFQEDLQTPAILNTGGTTFGTGANNGAAGVLPSTLGVITLSNSVAAATCPFVKLQG